MKLSSESRLCRRTRERGRAKLLNGDKEGSMEDMKHRLELNPKE